MMHMQTRAMRGMKATTARAKGKFACLLSVTEKIMHDLFLFFFFLFFSFKGMETLISEFEL